MKASVRTHPIEKEPNRVPDNGTARVYGDKNSEILVKTFGSINGDMECTSTS